MPEAARQLGVAEQTYYRWRKAYGGMDKSQARRLNQLERANARLRKLVPDLSLDKAMLEEALSKESSARPAAVSSWRRSSSG